MQSILCWESKEWRGFAQFKIFLFRKMRIHTDVLVCWVSVTQGLKGALLGCRSDAGFRFHMGLCWNLTLTLDKGVSCIQCVFPHVAEVPAKSGKHWGHLATLNKQWPTHSCKICQTADKSERGIWAARCSVSSTNTNWVNHPDSCALTDYIASTLLLMSMEEEGWGFKQNAPCVLATTDLMHVLLGVCFISLKLIRKRNEKGNI